MKKYDRKVWNRLTEAEKNEVHYQMGISSLWGFIGGAISTWLIITIIQNL